MNANERAITQLNKMVRGLANQLTILFTKEMSDEETEKALIQIKRKKLMLSEIKLTQEDKKKLALEILKSKKNELRVRESEAQLALQAAQLDLEEVKTELSKLSL